MAVEFEMSLKGNLAEFWDRAVKGLPEAMGKGVFAAAVDAVGVIDDKVKELFRPGTGDLRRSFQARFVTKTGKEISAGALSTLAYARVQDEGGTITPRTRRNLAIPINKGIPRGLWPRQFGELHWRPSRSPRVTGLLVNNLRKVKEKGRTVEKFDVQYALVRSVTIRGKNYLAKAEPIVAERSAEILAEATGRAFAKAAEAT